VTLITKMPPRVYMQRVRRNRDIYCDVKTLKCTSVYGLGSFNNQGIQPYLAPVKCHPRPKSHIFCFESVQPKHMSHLCTSFFLTEAYNPFLLRVLAKPRYKSCLELQKCHRAIICFDS